MTKKMTKTLITKINVGDGLTKRELECGLEFYKDAPFVKVVDAPPHTKHTWGNNSCLIYPTIDQRTGRLVVISAIDNLVKGGAGQAIQSFNLMTEKDASYGLDQPGIWP